jgi:integrase
MPREAPRSMPVSSVPSAPVRQRRQRRKVLTDTMVAALPSRPGQTYFHADPEMPKHGIRVRPAGPGTYTVITRDPYKKQRWIRIGNTAEMTIAEARAKARKVIERIEGGLEPYEAPKPQPDSVAAVAENWLHRHVAKKKLRTGDEMRRIIERYILPHLGSRNFVDVRRADIAKLLDHVEDNHGPAQADAVLSTLRAMATWVQSRDDTYTPPFVRNMRRVAKQDRKRSRILDDVELRAVWQHAENAGDFGAFVRILLLTAQRHDKVLDLQWDDIADAVWTIRTQEGEKGNAEAVKLPEVALKIINAQPRFVSNPWVFAGRHGRRGFNSRDKAAFHQASGVHGWRLHDLRRTARSLMSRAGAPSEHAELVLGHKVGGVRETYDRYEYLPEKSEALRKLAALIEMIVHPPADNVLPFSEAVPS